MQDREARRFSFPGMLPGSCAQVWLRGRESERVRFTLEYMPGRLSRQGRPEICGRIWPSNDGGFRGETVMTAPSVHEFYDRRGRVVYGVLVGSPRAGGAVDLVCCVVEKPEPGAGEARENDEPGGPRTA